MFRTLVIFALLAPLFAAEPAAPKPSKRFSYQHDENPEGPWSIHVVKIDRALSNVELQTTLPPSGHFELVTLSEQIKALGTAHGRPLVGINGDYYETVPPYLGDPKGLQICRGELISAPNDWTCFWMTPDGRPAMGVVDAHFEITLPDNEKIPFGLNEHRNHDKAVLYTGAIGTNTMTSDGTEFILECADAKAWLPLRASVELTARVADIHSGGNSPTSTNRVVLSIGPNLLAKIKAPKVGDTLKIKTSLQPDLAGVQTAIGGGPALVHQNKIVPRKEPRVRHPRSALGWNDKFIFLVEVDGRQPRLSVGMTFEELSDYLVSIGCDQAMSLDGGGSSTLWVSGQVMNNPCEGGERGMANGLVLISKPSH